MVRGTADINCKGVRVRQWVQFARLRCGVMPEFNITQKPAFQAGRASCNIFLCTIMMSLIEWCFVCACAQDIFFGTGNLADLLPDIEAEQFYDDMQQQAEEGGPISEDLDNAAAPAGRSGSLAGSDRSLTPYNSSQFPLLEETEPDQPTQVPQSKAALSKVTQLALR